MKSFGLESDSPLVARSNLPSGNIRSLFSTACPPPLDSLKGVIFDFDGTLFNTSYLHTEPVRAICGEIWGIEATQADFRDIYFKNVPRIPQIISEAESLHLVISSIGKQLGYPLGALPDAKDLVGLRDKFSRENMAKIKVEPLTDAIDYLHLCVAQKKIVTLCTNSPSSLVFPVLRRHELFDLFDHCLVGESLSMMGRKPSPAPYRASLELMGLFAHDVLVIEDSSAGAAAACTAGIRSILRPDSSRKEKVLDSLFRLLSDKVFETNTQENGLIYIVDSVKDPVQKDPVQKDPVQKDSVQKDPVQ